MDNNVSYFTLSNLRTCGNNGYYSGDSNTIVVVRQSLKYKCWFGSLSAQKNWATDATRRIDLKIWFYR